MKCTSSTTTFPVVGNCGCDGRKSAYYAFCQKDSKQRMLVVSICLSEGLVLTVVSPGFVPVDALKMIMESVMFVDMRFVAMLASRHQRGFLSVKKVAVQELCRKIDLPYK